VSTYEQGDIYHQLPAKRWREGFSHQAIAFKRAVVGQTMTPQVSVSSIAHMLL
jgi:hypothetical protein